MLCENSFALDFFSTLVIKNVIKKDLVADSFVSFCNTTYSLGFVSFVKRATERNREGNGAGRRKTLPSLAASPLAGALQNCQNCQLRKLHNLMWKIRTQWVFVYMCLYVFSLCIYVEQIQRVLLVQVYIAICKKSTQTLNVCPEKKIAVANFPKQTEWMNNM